MQVLSADNEIISEDAVDSHSGTRISEIRLARCFRGDLPRLADKLVLEAGSGAGTTEILLKAGATVHSFDYSNAVEANKLNNGHSNRLTLVQADIRRMPFPLYYDYVLCLEVYCSTRLLPRKASVSCGKWLNQEAA